MRRTHGSVVLGSQLYVSGVLSSSWFSVSSSVSAHLHLEFTILGHLLGDTESFQYVTLGTYLTPYVYEVGFGFFW